MHSFDPTKSWLPLPPHFRRSAADNANSILLETSRFDCSNHRSYLFLNPKTILLANKLEDIPGLFRKIELALNQGLWIAGYISYECGYHFQEMSGIPGSGPLIWFGVYETTEVHDHILLDENPGHANDADKGQTLDRCDLIAEKATLEISKADYVAAISRIADHLTAGDTYQVNFADRLAFETRLSALALYSTLSAQQRVAYSAFLNIRSGPVLSLSPELFFKVDGDRIVTRPMKGTVPRGVDSADDEHMAAFLRNDEKNRSEHVMIVDLLRNDLGQICRPGTIQVDSPFSIERYDTLHQMTSTVTGRLRPNMTFYEVFRGLFPSGSITGAPKHRTMQIIKELERHSRGVYTGAIGFISPDRSAVFNVAIRTLVMQDSFVTMGVGGGIVADSEAEAEYEECLLKASFITRAREPFRLIETLLWDHEFQRLDSHLDRMKSSAIYFGFPFDRSRVTAKIVELGKLPVFRSGSRQRIRIALAANGMLTTEVSALPNEALVDRVWLTDERVSSNDPFLRHKTTRRALYNRLYAEARNHGFADVIFSNEKGEITEGAISNIFIEKAGEMLTPPLASGVLPGVYRAVILATCLKSREAVLTVDDFKAADGIYLCSSLRGLRKIESFSTALA